MNKHTDGVSLEIQALQKTHEDSFHPLTKQINVLMLEAKQPVIDKARQGLLDREKPLTFEETQLLLALYPQTLSEKNLLIQALDEILCSETKINPYHVAELMLASKYNNHCFSLVENYSRKNMFSKKNHEYNNYVIDDLNKLHSILSQKTVENWQAKMILATVNIFDAYGEPEDLPYAKLSSFLKRSKHYSNIANLHYNTYEFSKFYLINHLSDGLLGLDKLPINRKKIFTLHPEQYYIESLEEAVLKETTIVENVTRGEELLRFLSISKTIAPGNSFKPDYVSWTQKKKNQYSVIPAFNSIVLTTKPLRPDDISIVNKFDAKKFMSQDFNKGYIEQQNRLTLVVEDAEAPIFVPEPIKITILQDETDVEGLNFVGETRFKGEDITISIGNPISLALAPLTLEIKKVKKIRVYVDKAPKATHIYLLGEG